MVKIDDYLKILECNKYLRDNIGKYKAAFLEYYGEEKRDLIEEQFSKVLLIACLSPDAVSIKLNELKEEKTADIIDKIMLEATSFDKDELFGKSFEYSNTFPISKYLKFLDLYNLGSEGRKDEFIKKGYDVIHSWIKSITKEEYMEMVNTGKILDKYQRIPKMLQETIYYYCDLKNADSDYIRSFEGCKDIFDKIDSSITIDNISEYINLSEFDELNKVVDLYKKGIDEYKEFMSKFSMYEGEDKEKLKQEINNKYYLELIKENIDLLPENRKDAIIRYINGEDKRYIFSDLDRFIFGYSLGGTKDIEAFSSESEDRINDDDSPAWAKDSIISDRIKYFRLMGINLGDDYKAYLNNEDVKKIWPDASRIDKYIESEDKIDKRAKIDFFDNLDENKKIRKEIDNLNLLDKEDSFNAAIYKSDCVAFVNPNLTMGENGFDLRSLLVVNIGNISENDIDHTICHELNHLFELYLLDVEDNNYSCTCGWDITNDKINQEVKSNDESIFNKKDKRSYELFNEIINELIAQDISKIMIDNDRCVFDSKDKAKYRGTTSYEHSIFLIRDFYNEFKEDIVESRTNGNIEVIWNKVGKENFDSLNDLFKIYYENFSGFKIYALYDALEKNEDNELTKVYYDLIEKRDKILGNMRDYSVSYEVGHAVSR